MTASPASQVEAPRWGRSIASSTAPDGQDLTDRERVRITHPFHPWVGQEFEFVKRCKNWRPDRVDLVDAGGELVSLPARVDRRRGARHLRRRVGGAIALPRRRLARAGPSGPTLTPGGRFQGLPQASQRCDLGVCPEGVADGSESVGATHPRP
ncbi:MAG: DUF5372 family protein, partial [Gammaproteobacteria bacterium]